MKKKLCLFFGVTIGVIMFGGGSIVSYADEFTATEYETLAQEEFYTEKQMDEMFNEIKSPEDLPNAITPYAYVDSISFQGHMQDIGWRYGNNKGKNDITIGTTGKGKRLEAIKFRIFYQRQFPWDPSYDENTVWKWGGFEINSHISKIGWQGYVKGAHKLEGTSGTTGRGLAIEAVKIKLYGEMGKKYDVYYSAHLKDKGWTKIYKNNQQAGTTGQNRRMEALRVYIKRK